MSFILKIAAACLPVFIISCGTNLQPQESGSVTITSPDCGETYVAGKNIDITWTETGIANVDRFVISFSGDTGSSWTEIGRVDPGIMSFSFVPTAEQTGDLCCIRVAGTGGSVSDHSGIVFSIVSPNVKFLQSCGTATAAIDLLYPEGGDTFKVGDVVQIKYAISDDFQYARVIAEISANGGRMPPASIMEKAVYPPARTFLWTIPQTITSGTMTISLPGQNYFRIRDYAGNQISPDMKIPVTILP